MWQHETILYSVAAIVQLAAMFYALKMMREVNDRRPWIALFIVLFIMFAYRVAMALFVMPDSVRSHIGTVLSLPLSLLMLFALFYMQKVAAAERESKLMALQRTVERDESDKRYGWLAELSPDVMFVHSEAKFAYVNAAAIQFFGAKDANDLLGRSPMDFVAPHFHPIVKERLARLTQIGHSVPPIAQDWLRLDGTVVPAEVAAAVVPWQGGMGVQVILRDISERVRAEQEKSQLLASERAARSSAERISRVKDEFLATLSHELRTPLNAILGWSQILRRSPKDQSQIEQGLETIERNARAQTKLIEDLLDMSRIISGKLRLDIQRITPIGAVEAAIETVLPSAEAKGVRLEQVLDPLAGPISGDPNRLQQVVWNILSNAIKFTPRGGKVQIVLARVNSHIEITVSDTGQGIRAEFIPHVFDRFRQADATTTRRHGGLGLGLSIVKHLVELHGGTVRMESPGDDQGTRVCVSLPVMAVQVQTESGPRLHPVNSRSKDNGHDAPIDLSGLKVLVVDDEYDACALLKRLLGECHAEVLTASSAAEAMPLIEKLRPDVLVSDIGMPDVDGYEFLRQVRALGLSRGGKVPAIALTAFARSEDRTRALMAGYSVHVSKPVEPQELVATVASLAGRTGVSRA